ncbi:MAG: sugar ABC transporter permease [Actinomycetota bacterium]|nr:sugar ABC transporter permease [Actinomycetota bacterium]
MGKTKIGDLFNGNIRQYGMIIALLVIIVLFQILTNGVLLYPQNVANLIMQNGYVIILAIGMLLCILTGGNIDLSVGSVVAFTGAIAGSLIIGMKMDVWLGVLITIIVGFAIGAWQGFWIAYVRVPPFIATLAGMLMFRGLTNAILKGLTLAPFPNSYLRLTGGFIEDIFNIPGINLNITCLTTGIVIIIFYIIFTIRSRRNKRKYNFEVIPFPLFILQILLVSGIIMLFFYWLSRYKGMPTVLLLIGFLIAVYTFVTQNTVFGRYIYAIGGNEMAARLSGIDPQKVMFFVYMNMGVLATITGIVFSARLNAASPVAGTNFELDAIGACFIGGASASGGVGTVIGAVIGALVMGVLNNGMSILGVGTEWQMVIKGMVLLAAVAFDVFSKSRSKI